VFLKLWSHETIRVDRKNHPDGLPLMVYLPFVAIVGGIQPAVIDQIRGGGRPRESALNDGFLDRFLMSYPEEVQVGAEEWRVVSEEAAVWQRVVNHLLGSRRWPPRTATSGPGSSA
jgi:hypothetical protein